MLRTASSAAVFRTVVGPGYAVCVCLGDKKTGGMVHFASDGFAGGCQEELVAKCIDDLLTALEENGGRARGAFAQIIGGADIIKLFPRHIQKEIVRRHVELIRSILEKNQIEVRRIQTGGVEGRRVMMTLPEGAVEISSVSRRRRTQIKPVGSDGLGERSGPAERPPEIAVNMGCLEVAGSPTRLTAILGSCVGVAIFDPETRTGGLAHVMMPRNEQGNGQRAKFADTAVPALVEALVRKGVKPRGLIAKLAGGASVLCRDRSGPLFQIGRESVRILKGALEAAEIKLVWEDTGGRLGRKMLVDLSDFRVVAKMLLGPERV